MTPNSVPTSEFVLGVAPPGHRWWPNPLLGVTSGPPALPMCSQWSRNEPNMTPKTPDCEALSSMLRGAGDSLTSKSVLVSWFLGFLAFGLLVAWLFGFLFLGFLASKFLGVLVSKFRRCAKCSFRIFWKLLIQEFIKQIVGLCRRPSLPKNQDLDVPNSESSQNNIVRNELGLLLDFLKVPWGLQR